MSLGHRRGVRSAGRALADVALRPPVRSENENCEQHYHSGDLGRPRHGSKHTGKHAASAMEAPGGETRSMPRLSHPRNGHSLPPRARSDDASVLRYPASDAPSQASIPRNRPMCRHGDLHSRRIRARNLRVALGAPRLRGWDRTHQGRLYALGWRSPPCARTWPRGVPNFHPLYGFRDARASTTLNPSRRSRHSCSAFDARSRPGRTICSSPSTLNVDNLTRRGGRRDRPNRQPAP